MNPQFSVIITCFNQSQYIREAVNSVLGQAFPSKEVIVVDDCSTDNSVEVLQQFETSITLIRHSDNKGPAVARNTGATLAKGEALVFLDGDDLLLPWTLQIYSRIVNRKQPILLLGALKLFKGDPPLLPTPKTIEIVDYDRLTQKDRGHYRSASALVIDRRTCLAQGGWTSGIFHGDDIDMLLKFCVSGRSIKIIHPPTSLYRFHSANSVRSVLLFSRGIEAILKKEKAGEYPGGYRCMLARYALLGGPTAFWTREAWRYRHYAEAGRLVLKGWPMILSSIVLRAAAYLRGRRPIETIDL